MPTDAETDNASTQPLQAEPEASSEELTQSLCPANAALYCEDDGEFTRFLQAFRDEHKPVGPTEDFLVQQLAAASWNTRRLGRIGIGLLDHQTDRALDAMPRRKPDAPEPTPEENYHTNTKLLGVAFHRDCLQGDALPKLSRCESLGERSFLRCLQQLERMRDRRKDRRSPSSASEKQ